MPALRRIIVLVAVLTAVPVAMWTITGVVRTYVGPPKLPTFQPMTASTLTDAPDRAVPAPDADTDNPAASAAEDAKAAPLPTVLEARATTTDARSAVGLSTVAAPPVALPSAADTADAIAAPSPAASAMPSPASDSVAPKFAAQQPPAENSPAAPAIVPLPPTEPIAGPVPLPRQRPRVFAMAPTGIPLPRPRPASAGPVTVETPAGPFDWLQSIFQPHQ